MYVLYNPMYIKYIKAVSTGEKLNIIVYSTTNYKFNIDIQFDCLFPTEK